MQGPLRRVAADLGLQTVASSCSTQSFVQVLLQDAALAHEACGYSAKGNEKALPALLPPPLTPSLDFEGLGLLQERFEPQSCRALSLSLAFPTWELQTCP